MMKRSPLQPFLMLGKVTFDERVNVLERYCKGDLSITFTNLNGSLSKAKVLKGLVSRSVRRGLSHINS